eukprot:scaffold164862_cov35-Attheya_sp.AAC.2
MAQIHYPSSQCTLYIKNEAVNRAYRSYMRRAYSSHDARKYLMQKYKWDLKTCEGIDWYSHSTAIKSLPYNQLRFVQRHIIDWLPINNRLFARGRIPSNLCAHSAMKDPKPKDIIYIAPKDIIYIAPKTNTQEQNCMNPYKGLQQT